MNEVLNFIFALALILLTTKIGGLLCRKAGLPQVLGYIVAGVLIGPAIFGDLFGWSIIDIGNNTFGGLVSLTDENGGQLGLETFAKIGVLIIMFISGMETDLGEVKSTGVVSGMVAFVGVIVPMGLGFLVCVPFVMTGVLNTETFTFDFINALFVGVVLTATSVALTVSVLREMGKLQGKIGTIILSAAIIDDIIGIIILSVMVGLFGDSSADSGLLLEMIMNTGVSESLEPLFVVLMIVAFFILAIGAGLGFNKLFKYFDKKWPKSHRIPLFSLVLCFVYSYVAEVVFGVADITGAFLAGLVISTNKRNSHYVDSKLDVTSYLLFSPVFFASIGINMNLIDGFSNGWMILAIMAITIVGLLSKVLACGLTAKCYKINTNESLVIGIGMMSRGEVSLIVSEKGVTSGLLDSSFTIVSVFMTLLSAILVPIFLKMAYAVRDVKRNKAIAGGHIEPPTYDDEDKNHKYVNSLKLFVYDSIDKKQDENSVADMCECDCGCNNTDKPNEDNE